MNPEVVSYRKDSQECRKLLLEGGAFRGEKRWLAFPREKIMGAAGVDSVIFEWVDPASVHALRPSWPRLFWTFLRPDRWASLCAPLGATLVDGFFKNWTFSPLLSVFAFFGVFCLQWAAHAWNDVEDYLRLVDVSWRQGYVSPFEPGLIQKGWLTARQVRSCGAIAFALGLLLGMLPVLQSPPWLCVLGCVAFFSVWAYSGQPFGLKYRLLGDFCFCLLQGPLLTLGFAQASFGQFDLSVGLLGCSFGLLSWNTSHVTHLASGFLAEGRGTSWFSVLGFQGSRHLSLVLVLCSSGLILIGALLGLFPTWILVAILLGTPEFFRFFRKLYRASGPASALLGNIKNEILRLHFKAGVWIVFGFFLAVFFK